MSFVMSVRPLGTTRLPLDGFSWNLILEHFSENLSRKCKFHQNRTRMTGLDEDICTFMAVSRWSLLRLRNVPEKLRRENQNTHFILSNFFFSSENRAVYEIMWKNIVQPGRPQMTIWCMRIACWITKATNTHSDYVRIVAFQQQQWLHERPSMLRYTYFACLFISK